jgi:hypothetical protein
MSRLPHFRALYLAGAALSPPMVALAQTSEAPMVLGLNGFETVPLITVGESVNDIDGGSYQFTGIPDGIGAFELDESTVRVLMNHEFGAAVGTSFTLANGVVLPSGARVSIFDIDKKSREVVAGGPAFTSVHVGEGTELTPANAAAYIAAFDIFDRLCSSSLAGPAEGLADYVYFCGEETAGGRLWALDVGNGAWENAIGVPTVGTPAANKTVMIASDDTQGRPIYLYVGDKIEGSADFPARNGLRNGQLYVFATGSGANTNTEFSGTGSMTPGTFVPLTSNNPGADLTQDGLYDKNDDIMNMNNLVTEAGHLGAFFFSRPEDVAFNPLTTVAAPGWAQVAFASTGRVINLGDIDGDGADDEIDDP